MDKIEFKETSVTHGEMLYYHDTLKLKLSFIWAIKGSLNWQDALSFHWVQHPVSGDNRNFRGIRHGIRLEALDLSLGRYGFSGINETLIGLYIIDDLFKCLWRQYKTLAQRPQGVSVQDGWRELRVPEYYICRKSKTDEMYLYRKKQL